MIYSICKRYFKATVVIIFTISALFHSASAYAQSISGTVTDSITGEPVPYLAVYYEGTGVGTITDLDGKYSLETKRKNYNRLTFSAVGYNKKTLSIVPMRTQTLDVKISPSDIQLSEVVVKPHREKYSRKDNPAVELMKKVIAHKSKQSLKDNAFYQYDTYVRTVTAMNDIKPDMLDKGIFKKLPFLVNQVQPCVETNKLILPFSIQETAAKHLYRKNPESEKTVIEGETSTGIEQLFSTGASFDALLKDIFRDVNIYDDEITLLGKRFISPISSASAISFYKFYIMDTTYVDSTKVINLSFVPNNSQDVGFTGQLYVTADSTYAVRKCVMNLPKNTGVNFVESLNISQRFKQLPNGQWVLEEDEMLAELYAIKAVQGVQIRRWTSYSNFSFEPFTSRIFKMKGDVVRTSESQMQSDEFWAEKRQVPMTKQETMIDSFVKRLQSIKGVKYVIVAAQMLIENFVELSKPGKPSKVDLGPLNTLVSANYVDGARIRLSGQTTANLHPHLFLSGYVAYGFKDKRMKYMGKAEYSFNKKKYLAREFPKNSISLSYRYDVMSPMDKFLRTDKDNIFVALKSSTVDQMSYVRDITATYEKETTSGFSMTLSASHKTDEPTGNLFYIPLNADKNDPTSHIHEMMTMEFGVKLRYAPGETFINTKQRRRPLNLDAPVFTLSHTVGVKGLLGGDYNYNFTEAGIFKRFWLRSWGKVDIDVKGGVQWNKVPFPLLIMPEANLSFITQKNTFNMINNMEFLADRYASLMIRYDMGGKLFNRIPLIKKLKWREAFGFNLFYGDLSDKNNPFKNPGDGTLYRFPERNGEFTSFVMNRRMPYMEVSAGIHNIFKILHIDYVRRLNYLDNPNVNKNGVRLMLRVEF